MDSYVSKNGEITSKDESLLNTIPASSHTHLSFAVMNVLSCEDLESIRDSLLQKCDNVIARNADWLKGLSSD